MTVYAVWTVYSIELTFPALGHNLYFPLVESNKLKTWWNMQINKGNCKDSSDSPLVEDFQTTLSYTVDVKPKMWLPVRVVEGRICNEIKSNLVSIRDAAQKLINKSLPTL